MTAPEITKPSSIFWTLSLCNSLWANRSSTTRALLDPVAASKGTETAYLKTEPDDLYPLGNCGSYAVQPGVSENSSGILGDVDLRAEKECLLTEGAVDRTKRVGIGPKE